MGAWLGKPTRSGTGGNMKSPLPYETWSWRGSVLVLLAVATPAAPLAILTGNTTILLFATTLYGLILAPAVLAAAVAAYGAWRISPQRERGWFSATLGMLALHELSLAVLQVTAPHGIGRHDVWPRIVDLVVIGAIAAAAWWAPKVDLPADPLGLGLLAGTVTGALRICAATQLPDVEMGTAGTLVVLTLYVALVAFACSRIARLIGVGPGIGASMAAGAVLIGAGQLTAVFLPQTHVSGMLTLMLDSAGAAVVARTGLMLLCQALAEELTNVERLSEKVLTAEEGARASRATMHEVTATLAGITSATHLLHSPQVSRQRRVVLQQMVDDELARLNRLVSRPTIQIPSPRTVDLDATLETLTLAHEARGNPVRWRPSGVHVVGQPDDLTEVLNILLDNAAKHGGGADPAIEVTRLPQGIEIAVSDQGPGVTPGVEVFEWGNRGPASKGQGIGLHIARELMERQGGYLRLRASQGRGCTFVLGLPHQETRHDASTSAHAS